MREFTCALAGALIGAAPAAAACPVAGDLERGIRIDYADGGWEVYRSAGEGTGVVAVEGFVPEEGQIFEMRLARGLHVLDFTSYLQSQPDTLTHTTYDYGAGPTDLPVPEPGGRWQARVVVRDPEGLRAERQLHVYDAAVAHHIGECAYTAIPVAIGYDTSSGYIEGVQYLAELGFGYLSWFESADEPRRDYTATAIAPSK